MKFKPNEKERKILQLNGLPGYVFADRPFKLDDHLKNYVSTTEGLKPLPIKKQDMLGFMDKVLDNPTHSPYCMCISSEPNDSKAKLLAASIMLEAIRDRQVCKWHNIIGGYKDEIRDKPKLFKKVKLLILSNVPDSSTDLKYEKLRDILEIYHNVPRIVITTGCEPITYFNYLGFHLHYPIWIRSARCQRIL